MRRADGPCKHVQPCSWYCAAYGLAKARRTLCNAHVVGECYAKHCAALLCCMPTLSCVVLQHWAMYHELSTYDKLWQL